MNILSMLGLMKVEDHAKVATANKGLLRDILAERDKFKKAVRDLAALSEANAGLTTDAQKWRDRAAREHARRTKRTANDAAPKAKKGVRS